MPERMVITPELARQFLARGEADVDQARVARYASEMRSGRWDAERSTIYIFDNGVLCDGWHRLHACAEADRSFPTLVVRDVPSRWTSALPPPTAIEIPTES